MTGRIAAGHPLGRPAKKGEALRIFTGAPMPEGVKSQPDTIFMDEDCTIEKTPLGEVVVLPEGLKLGANRRFAGEDIKSGDLIVSIGKQLRPQEIGLVASVGLDTLKVYKSLRVAVFSTGDEVSDPGKEIDLGCIYDANRHAVIALLKSLGCEVSDLGIIEDDTSSITKALAIAASNHDLLVTSGGVSSGEEDHVKEAVEALGQVDLWRLAIKPRRVLLHLDR